MQLRDARKEQKEVGNEVGRTMGGLGWAAC